MTQPNYIPPTTIQLGSELIVIVDDGEEWSFVLGRSPVGPLQERLGSFRPRRFSAG